ncbi:hypothetical protein [Caballeronia glathei]|uniref:hypothetical protein n=1 Tax=Caballeronia glathei TaxID=60547 RepID=UPI001593DC7F|nr:hypothetical protein [Caballeronia glathei]
MDVIGIRHALEHRARKRRRMLRFLARLRRRTGRDTARDHEPATPSARLRTVAPGHAAQHRLGKSRVSRMHRHAEPATMRAACPADQRGRRMPLPDGAAKRAGVGIGCAH